MTLNDTTNDLHLEADEEHTFADLGVIPEICEALAQVGAERPWLLDGSWSTGDEDVLGLAGLPDGGFYTVSQPRQTSVDHKALARRAADGSLVWARVVRDAAGAEMRPIADAASRNHRADACRPAAPPPAPPLL